MGLVDLGPIQFPALSEKLAPVLLTDGPCAARYAMVPGNVAECWERVGAPGRVGVESQMWACYRRRWDGAWVYAGITCTTDEVHDAIGRLTEDGHTYGESYGA